MLTSEICFLHPFVRCSTHQPETLASHYHPISNHVIISKAELWLAVGLSAPELQKNTGRKIYYTKVPTEAVTNESHLYAFLPSHEKYGERETAHSTTPALFGNAHIPPYDGFRVVISLGAETEKPTRLIVAGIWNSGTPQKTTLMFEWGILQATRAGFCLPAFACRKNKPPTYHVFVYRYSCRLFHPRPRLLFLVIVQYFGRLSYKG